MDTNLFEDRGASDFASVTSEKEAALNEMSTFETYNKILLIEDNPGDARLVELLLGESDLLNYKITNSTRLSDAMAILEENDDFAAILLDLTLPDSRGFETLERLLSKYPDNNVIVLTGLSDKSLGISAVKAGAQDFLIKGAFDTDTLAKTLRYSIERQSVLKRLEETQRLAHIGNWEFNTSNGEFIASDTLFNIFGIEQFKKNLSQEEWMATDSPLQLFDEIHKETIANRTIKKDIQIQRKDGQKRYVFIQCVADKNAAQQIVLNGVIQDITERKLAEQAMIKSQKRYQDIFASSKDGIYICSSNGQLIDFNPTTIALLGYNEKVMREMDIHQVFYPEAAKVSFLDKLEEKGAVHDFEIEITCNNGERKHCLVSANKMEFQDFTGYTGIIRDITERKQTEELIKARDLARKSAMMKEQFIASISHEMRTPLNAVLGMSNLVLKTELNDDQFNYLSSIKQSSEILLGIINDILEISSIQNGKVEFENKDFSLNELVSNLVNVMTYKIQEKDLDFILEIDPNISSYLKGDKLRLNQILYNLVGNAVKFTDHGFIRLSVQILNENDNIVQLKFIIEDSGIGIPQDKLEAIFDSFTRVRTKDRVYEGTGLGLSIAKNLVEQQGGKMGVKSSLGEGATFFFDLVFEKGAQPNTEDGQKNTDAPSIDLDQMVRLLLVEDHKMNQLVARKTLERQWGDKIQITLAENGEEAIQKLNEATFDIILMDIQMPIMNGYEATDYIRNKMPEAIATMPILAMTAHAHISKDEKYKEFGMDDFVLKPFEPKQLFQKIAYYVKRRNNKPHE